MLDTIPVTAPHQVAPDTYLIPHVVPTGPDTFLPFSSYLIAGREPVIVDTGLAIFRETWLAQVESLIELEDVRWIFISHDDSDHVGNLPALLERCPRATVIANSFITERMGVDPFPIPIERTVWMEDGDTFRAGDHELRLFIPPIYDGVTTRGLFDESTGAMWTVDSFACFIPEGGYDVADVPSDLYEECFPQFSSMVSPWREWLDPARYAQHVDRLEDMGALSISSAHGPVLSGDAIPDAYDRVKRYAGEPRAATPGPEVLEAMVAEAAAAAEVALLAVPDLEGETDQLASV